ncbi:MAG TPA: DUF2000 domain-containing protein [Mycobacteriales bacterium]|jgi:hypothetical protein|nr:DUF2000 domain-containing protein [Mycobacteriales bacterium]
MITGQPGEVGFAADEINTAEPTRSARLKWIIVVDQALPAGRAVNAAVCVASATGRAVAGLLGPDAKDGAGSVHAGLPWAGCSILGATTEQLTDLRARAVGAEEVFVADMPSQAQSTRVYDEYLQQVSAATEISYYAVSLVGPRNRIDKLAKKLSLLP